tara:strand:+ start:545 stop:700 length:156 start_codon:yes stop_codon:yes gene_type:complete
MYYESMNPDFFQSPDPVTHIGIWKTIIGLLIVLFASFVGVEISIGNDDEEQ